MSSVRLKGEGVAKRFGRVAALRQVDFEIDAGEAVAILGANGAGKSTLLRILAGLSRPSSGRFEALATTGGAVSTRGGDGGDGGGVDGEGGAPGENSGQPLSRDTLRGAVGYVGHATLLYGELTARENLAFAARLQNHAADRDSLDALLDRFALLDVADRRAGGFSRGMAQRLSIARAIVHEPQILLLDEPFTGLDEASADRLSEQLSQLRAGGRTLLVVTHDPRRAVELTDRALLLHRGEIHGRPGRSASDGAGKDAAKDAADAFEVDALRERLRALAQHDSQRDVQHSEHNARRERAGSAS